jgi:DNA-directed RNA polymerase alpha subunit
MISWQRISVALFSVAVSAPLLAAQSVKVTESKPGLLKKAKITADSAIAVARATLPKATISSAEIEQENGKLIFSFDMKTAGKSGIDEVNVDALTGKLVGKPQHESAADEKKEADADAAKKPVKKPKP